MNIDLQLSDKLRQILIKDTPTQSDNHQLQLELDTDTSLYHAIHYFASSGPVTLRNYLFDNKHNLNPDIIFFVNDQQVLSLKDYTLKENDTVRLLSPTAGG